MHWFMKLFGKDRHAVHKRTDAARVVIAAFVRNSTNEILESVCRILRYTVACAHYT